MNRREWLRGAALIGAGVVAADQLELLDRLGWKRRFFAGAEFDTTNPREIVITLRQFKFNGRFLASHRAQYPLDVSQGYGLASIPEA